REDVIEYAGRLDPLIIEDLLTAHALATGPAEVDRFRDGYRRHLIRLLETPGVARPCPGVMDLLDALRGEEQVTLGLLTGNYPETGRIKLEAAGIDPARFHLAVWGSDSPHTPPARDHLPPVGIAKYREIRRAAIEPERVVVIGDTPHDVRCALVNGCRALGVATGSYTVAQLEDVGAHRAVETLEDTDEVLRWLMNGTSTTRTRTRATG
ncbi:MAG: HAD hydrolase-like protein, partial [Planctomycetota bacterium]|nr:HAD hydrolase-like protein [Planctomycetota bacterium]